MNWYREILKDVGALTDAQMTLDLRIKSLEMDILHLLGDDVDTPIHSVIVDEMESIRHRIHLSLVSMLMAATNINEPVENEESDLDGLAAREAP